MYLQVQSCKLVHIWCTLLHVCIHYKWLCFCILHCTVLHSVQKYSIFISSPGCPEQASKQQGWSWCCWRTGGIHDAGMAWAWDFPLNEESLSFEAQDPNEEQYLKVVAAVQNTAQGCHVIYDKKESYYPPSLVYSFKRVEWNESSKKPVPSTSGVNEIVAFALCLLLLTVLQHYHHLSPLSTPFSNFLSVHSMLAPICQRCTVLPYLSRYCTVSLKLFYFSFFCMICVKSIINLLQYSTI